MCLESLCNFVAPRFLEFVGFMEFQKIISLQSKYSTKLEDYGLQSWGRFWHNTGSHLIPPLLCQRVLKFGGLF